MKLIENLAVVCAKRPDVLLQIYEETVSVYVNFGPERTYMMAAWDDDAKISQIIHELNHGKFAVRNQPKQYHYTVTKAA